MSSQQFGDSFRRQNELIKEWIAQNPGYELDDLTYQDLGLSAFSGAHASRGALADFLDAVEHGFIPQGTALLVESLDRLSREKIGEASERLRRLLKAGIDVVTLSDHTRYTQDSLDDPYVLIKAILIAQRANEESEIKSRRMRSAWQKKREEAEKTGKLITRSCPRWLKVSATGESFEVREEYVATLIKIFRLRLKGHSLNGITKILNDKKVITLTGETAVWNPSTIEKLLSNKALIGTFVPSYRTVSKGAKEIPGYYPAVIPEKLFNDVQNVRLKPYGRQKLYDNPYLINLFRSVLRCGCCGHSMIMSGIDGRGMGYYVCPMRRLHRCHAPATRRDIIDAVLIETVIPALDYLHHYQGSINSVRQLESDLLGMHTKVNRLIEAIQIAPDVGPLAEKLHALNKEINVAEARLHALKTRAKKITGENIVRLDLGSTKERELCRDFIGRRFEKIIMYTANGTCDIYLENGIRLMGFSLRKRMDPQSLISACEYLDDGTLYF